MDAPREWTLVRTVDGYYGVVTDVRERTVFLANGLEEILTPEDWEKLVVMPLNIFAADGAQANFDGLMRAMTLPTLRDLEQGR